MAGGGGERQARKMEVVNLRVERRRARMRVNGERGKEKDGGRGRKRS